MDWHFLAYSVEMLMAVYLVGLTGLVILGRRPDAAAVARFVPDCAILFVRLVRDPRVARRHKLLLVAVAAYLAMPIDLVPDFIPVAGQLDDAIIVSLALRAMLRGADDHLFAEHWPGPAASLALVEHLAGAQRPS